MLSHIFPRHFHAFHLFQQQVLGTAAVGSILLPTCTCPAPPGVAVGSSRVWQRQEHEGLVGPGCKARADSVEAAVPPQTRRWQSQLVSAHGREKARTETWDGSLRAKLCFQLARSLETLSWKKSTTMLLVAHLLWFPYPSLAPALLTLCSAAP